MNTYTISIKYPVIRNLSITCAAEEFDTKVKELFGIIGENISTIFIDENKGQISCRLDYTGSIMIYGEFSTNPVFEKLLFVKRKNTNEPSSFKNIDIPCQKLLYEASMIIDDTGRVLKNRYDIQGHRVKLDTYKIEFNRLYDMIFETSGITSRDNLSFRNNCFIITRLTTGDYISNRRNIFLSDFKKPIPDNGVSIRVSNSTVTIYADGSFELLIDGEHDSIVFDKGDHELYYKSIEQILTEYNI